MLARQRGDTIVEVLLAFAVFSLVSVGSMVVMGQGTNASQRALEITMVRQQIDAQAEALRAAQQAFTVADPNVATQWEQIATKSTADNSQHFDDTSSCPKGPNDVIGSFIMDPRDASLVSTATPGGWIKDINGSDNPPPYAKLVVDGSTVNSYGMWIERTYYPVDGKPGSYDFTVRSCWYSAGLSVPLQIETSVRLYEPSL